MSFDPINNPVDVVILGGRATPGLAEIVNAGSPREWDKRRGAYLSGATLRFKGIDLAVFSIRLSLWEPGHFEDWDRLAVVLRRPPAFERPEAIDIVHPITEQLGIAQVVIVDVGQPVQTADGLWTVEIKVQEHRALARAVGGPIVGSSNEEPASANQRRIAEQLLELEQLNARAAS